MCRGLTASSGWNVQVTFSPPAAVTRAAKTSSWISADRVRVPAVVVTVPVSSAFHRLSRQSTAVTVPTGSRVRCPTGSRQPAAGSRQPAAGRCPSLPHCLEGVGAPPAELRAMVLDPAVRHGEADPAGARLLHGVAELPGTRPYVPVTIC
ncbi:hypothetical protein GCM10010339_56220 [Streptomyces alanosinicus]|uniref:Uncharacterized protein n=1 Tax=Streptomyces alanosinicus TaxID=68171 RepID=A0A919D4T6_9ACTN|nr:hypothetical protein GCM10010339_56220 [Streptomyces alanosinicus]